TTTKIDQLGHFAFCGNPTAKCEWDQRGEIDRLALSIILIRTALLFWGRPADKHPSSVLAQSEFDRKYPPAQGECDVIARWLNFPAEEREAALGRTLNCFVGVTLRGLLKELRRQPLPGSTEYERRVWPSQHRAAQQVSEWMRKHGYH